MRIFPAACRAFRRPPVPGPVTTICFLPGAKAPLPCRRYPCPTGRAVFATFPVSAAHPRFHQLTRGEQGKTPFRAWMMAESSAKCSEPGAARALTAPHTTLIRSLIAAIFPSRCMLRQPEARKEKTRNQSGIRFINGLPGRKEKGALVRTHREAIFPSRRRDLPGIASLFDQTEKKITCPTAPLAFAGHVPSPSLGERYSGAPDCARISPFLYRSVQGPLCPAGIIGGCTLTAKRRGQKWRASA